MSMKRKDFTPKKELETGKQLDNGETFNSTIKVLVRFVACPLNTRHYFSVYKTSIR